MAVYVGLHLIIPLHELITGPASYASGGCGALYGSDHVSCCAVFAQRKPGASSHVFP